MPNGDSNSAEWRAIEEGRNHIGAVEQRQAAHDVRLRAVERSDEKLERKLDDFRDDILGAVGGVEDRLNKRFDRQRAAIVAGLGLGLPLITALVSALLASGGHGCGIHWKTSGGVGAPSSRCTRGCV